jgi:hypothetical protein
VRKARWGQPVAAFSANSHTGSNCDMLAGYHSPLSIILKQRMDSVNSMCSAVNCLQEIKDHQKDDETELQPLRNMFKESVIIIIMLQGPLQTQ